MEMEEDLFQVKASEEVCRRDQLRERESPQQCGELAVVCPPQNSPYTDVVCSVAILAEPGLRIELPHCGTIVFRP